MQRTGTESFIHAGSELGFDLLSFWRWMGSDLVGNSLRGKLAEYIVARALGLGDGVRLEWDAYDLKTSDGLRIEVKSASYVQSWPQQKLSKISFDIAPKTAWFAETNTYATEKRRSGDLYVFALLGEPERRTVNPLDLAEWKFFVLPTCILDERCTNQQRISLGALLKLEPRETRWDGLADAVRSVGVR